MSCVEDVCHPTHPTLPTNHVRNPSTSIIHTHVKQIWAVAAYGAIRGTPVITGDGRAVLAAAADGVLYALSTAQGACPHCPLSLSTSVPNLCGM